MGDGAADCTVDCAAPGCAVSSCPQLTQTGVPGSTEYPQDGHQPSMSTIESLSGVPSRLVPPAGARHANGCTGTLDSGARTVPGNSTATKGLEGPALTECVWIRWNVLEVGWCESVVG